MQTYRRKLTAEEQAMREAYRPLAVEDHQDEVDEDEKWDDEADFNL
jgi:hypothetical protein